MSKRNQYQKKNSSLEDKRKKAEDRYKSLRDELTELKEQLSDMDTRETIENFLKNEAYAFLISEGLLDEFVVFREGSARTRSQNEIYNLVTSIAKKGLWIEE